MTDNLKSKEYLFIFWKSRLLQLVLLKGQFLNQNTWASRERPSHSAQKLWHWFAAGLRTAAPHCVSAAAGVLSGVHSQANPGPAGSEPQGGASDIRGADRSARWELLGRSPNKPFQTPTSNLALKCLCALCWNDSSSSLKTQYSSKINSLAI